MNGPLGVFKVMIDHPILWRSGSGGCWCWASWKAYSGPLNRRTEKTWPESMKVIIYGIWTAFTCVAIARTHAALFKCGEMWYVLVISQDIQNIYCLTNLLLSDPRWDQIIVCLLESLGVMIWVSYVSWFDLIEFLRKLKGMAQNIAGINFFL